MIGEEENGPILTLIIIIKNGLLYSAFLKYFQFCFINRTNNIKRTRHYLRSHGFFSFPFLLFLTLNNLQHYLPALSASFFSWQIKQKSVQKRCFLRLYSTKSGVGLQENLRVEIWMELLLSGLKHWILVYNRSNVPISHMREHRNQRNQIISGE